MTNTSKTMKDVVAQLRHNPEEAFLELLELDVTVGEVACSAQVLCAGAREIAQEAQELANMPGLVSPDRLQALASYASRVSNTAEAHSKCVSELKAGIAAWSLV